MDACKVDCCAAGPRSLYISAFPPARIHDITSTSIMSQENFVRELIGILGIRQTWNPAMGLGVEVVFEVGVVLAKAVTGVRIAGTCHTGRSA